jgi:radical SAM protein with 4Fe4S-binding SPASM domain
MFGYHLLHDDRAMPGEKYVSASGAVMLSVLNKSPQDIEVIIRKLSAIFTGVEYDELKQDTIDFYMQLVDEGFLDYEETTDPCMENLFNPNDFLRSIHIEVANECNERCVHCYIPHQYKNKVMDTELFYRIVEEGRAMNIINVTISGGEPLIHKDIIGFLVRCRELDLSVNLLTNLTLLTDDIVFEMKKNPLLSVQTSLYSMDPEVHDSITKVKGSFEKTKNGILKLLHADIPVQISCPVMKQNKDTFMDVVKWGDENNAAVSIDYEIFAAYDHTNCNLSNRLSLQEIEEAFSRQLTKEQAASLSETAEQKNLLARTSPVCSICRYYFCVSVEGDVFPCVGWQTNKIGSLKDNSIKELWESSEKIRELRQITREKFPQCIECADRGYCTICMMSNSNENSDGDAFRVNDFHCKVASMIHSKVISYQSTE